jgi:hypothetical protein
MGLLRQGPPGWVRRVRRTPPPGRQTRIQADDSSHLAGQGIPAMVIAMPACDLAVWLRDAQPAQALHQANPGVEEQRNSH